MNFLKHSRSLSIATTLVVAMLFSCVNNTQEVWDLLAEKNLPIGISKNAVHVYKDSGRVTSKLITPLLKDYSNREEHPYNEFPEGLVLVTYENNGLDSITIVGDYALTYSKTMISEIRGNVVVINHTDRSKLETPQLFWDQNTDYFFSEKAFTLTNPTDTIRGVGFESKKDLTAHVSKQISGNVLTNEN